MEERKTKTKKENVGRVFRNKKGGAGKKRKGKKWQKKQEKEGVR